MYGNRVTFSLEPLWRHVRVRACVFVFVYVCVCDLVCVCVCVSKQVGARRIELKCVGSCRTPLSETLY